MYLPGSHPYPNSGNFNLVGNICLLICKHSQFSAVQLLSHILLCNPMACSMPSFPVHHQLPEFTPTHVHRVRDAIQPTHPLSSPSPPAFNLSQHQGFFSMRQCFTSGGPSIGVSASTSVFPMNIQTAFL